MRLSSTEGVDHLILLFRASRQNDIFCCLKSLSICHSFQDDSKQNEKAEMSFAAVTST